MVNGSAILKLLQVNLAPGPLNQQSSVLNTHARTHARTHDYDKPVVNNKNKYILFLKSLDTAVLAPNQVAGQTNRPDKYD